MHQPKPWRGLLTREDLIPLCPLKRVRTLTTVASHPPAAPSLFLPGLYTLHVCSACMHHHVVATHHRFEALRAHKCEVANSSPAGGERATFLLGGLAPNGEGSSLRKLLRAGTLSLCRCMWTCFFGRTPEIKPGASVELCEKRSRTPPSACPIVHAGAER